MILEAASIVRCENGRAQDAPSAPPAPVCILTIDKPTGCTTIALSIIEDGGDLPREGT